MRRRWIAVLALGVLILSGIVFSEESKTANFTGAVVGSDGAPVEAASVNLYLLTIDQGSLSFQVQSLAEAKSDVEGKFSFAVDTKDIKGYAV